MKGIRTNKDNSISRYDIFKQINSPVIMKCPKLIMTCALIVSISKIKEKRKQYDRCNPKKWIYILIEQAIEFWNFYTNSSYTRFICS